MLVHTSTHCRSDKYLSAGRHPESETIGKTSRRYRDRRLAETDHILSGLGPKLLKERECCSNIVGRPQDPRHQLTTCTSTVTGTILETKTQAPDGTPESRDGAQRPAPHIPDAHCEDWHRPACSDRSVHHCRESQCRVGVVDQLGLPIDNQRSEDTTGAVGTGAKDAHLDATSSLE